MIVILYIAEVC